MSGKRIQVYLDDIILEKWETFLNNNSAIFKNPTTLFRYMVSNIELLTVKNPNLISKNEGKIKELEREVENLKLENLKLKSEMIKKGNDDATSLLKEISYKLDILEVINSTSFTGLSSIEVVSPKNSTIYKKAKMKVDLNTEENKKEVISKEDSQKRNKLFDIDF